ncbi:MAG: sensor histidine kinase, partial [Acidimicrobiales bacterium]
VNACRFSPPAGSISVRVAGSTATGWEVSVADRGQGISPSDLPKVFDRLWRADVQETGVSRGAGLGLAIVRELAERHGGTATATSAKGRGSTFRVSLPPPPG